MWWIRQILLYLLKHGAYGTFSKLYVWQTMTNRNSRRMVKSYCRCIQLITWRIFPSFCMHSKRMCGYRFSQISSSLPPYSTTVHMLATCYYWCLVAWWWTEIFRTAEYKSAAGNSWPTIPLHKWLSQNTDWSTPQTFVVTVTACLNVS